jgi:hypothetical protein
MPSPGNLGTPVDDKRIVAGINLAEWFGHETERVYAVLNDGPKRRTRQLLIELLQSKGAMTLRDISRSPGFVAITGKLEAALDGLVSAGLVEWKYPPPPPTGGRPTKYYSLAVCDKS